MLVCAHFFAGVNALDIPLIDLSRITRETFEQLARVGRTIPQLPNQGSTGAFMPDPVAATPVDEQEKSGRRQLPLGNDSNVGVALAEAPEHFFAQDQWDEFVSCCGDRKEALGRISYADHPSLILRRTELAQQPTSGGAKAREEERIYRLGQSLVEDFRAHLMSGEYIATSLQPPSIERVAIPAELHSELILDFKNNVEMGGEYNFKRVRIIKSARFVGRGTDVTTRIADWLAKSRTQRGEELKKTLLDAARHEFGDECTSRAFEAAYRQIYSRRRGRPPVPRRE
jgi:hypothetical protein